ncbi:phosphoribosyltransferase family protein [Actinoplanes sp. TBRC 11911]|uniref:phosphoribosyltransferase n=1 Tax=Actinoplanes sp. TBRC 11911 TaxID=2729386 RepID=UPI00289FE2F1|nr:phosphoribosyltransferase family protein [Actinoplanes sp. TBRC 11911]
MSRTHAGELLAGAISHDKSDKSLVLALPRGGVPVAVPVAERLGADLDIVVARKIGAPGREELGVGAIAEDGPPVFDEDTLVHFGLTPDDLAGTVAREREEIARRVRRYRAGRPAPDATGRTVILVDDGLATGVTARAALRWLRGQHPARLVLAVPVCSWPARDAIAGDADEIVCLSTPPSFRAVGEWYEDFRQLSDHDVELAMKNYV